MSTDLPLADTVIADAVIESLSHDPRIPDAAEIAVSAKHGVVTLRGTVESFAQRRAAAEDARKLEGAYEVHNQLKVDLRGSSRRPDHEIRGAALQMLMWDVEVPSQSIDVKVQNGWVTLTGDVRHQYQSDAAYEDVARLHGVVDVTNEIRVNARGRYASRGTPRRAPSPR
jgi:osmotically-inducible protein OsmY